MLCGFVLEDNLCKIHTLQKLDGRFSNEKAVKEMLVFTKAFLETYNQKIDKIQISDYADWGYDYPVTYKNIKSIIDENTKGFLKKYLIFNPSLIKNQDIIKTNIKNSFTDSINKNLSLDDKINLYTTNNKTNDSIEITR